MPYTCCVINCKSSGRMKERKFYRFPMIDKHTANREAMSRLRQQAWIKALNKPSFMQQHIKYAKVCDLHFVSGRSAKIYEITDVDWVPTLAMGHTSEWTYHNDWMATFLAEQRAVGSAFDTNWMPPTTTIHTRESSISPLMKLEPVEMKVEPDLDIKEDVDDDLNESGSMYCDTDDTRESTYHNWMSTLSPEQTTVESALDTEWMPSTTMGHTGESSISPLKLGSVVETKEEPNVDINLEVGNDLNGSENVYCDTQEFAVQTFEIYHMETTRQCRTTQGTQTDLFKSETRTVMTQTD